MARVEAAADRTRPRLPETPRAGISISEFCRRWGISRATFDNWRKVGRGPQITQPIRRGRALISIEAEAAWARQYAQRTEAAE